MTLKTAASYCSEHAVRPTLLARKNAQYWEEGHPRNKAVAALKSSHLTEWETGSDCHQHSLSEAAMSRYKQLLSPTLSLHKYKGHVGEILAGKVMNNVIGLGMPVRQP